MGYFREVSLLKVMADNWQSQALNPGLSVMPDSLLVSPSFLASSCLYLKAQR